MPKPPQWEQPIVFPTLATDEVHVWRFNLSQLAPLRAELSQTLARDERTRAAKFRFDQHREQFILARGALRFLLGRYLNSAPQELVFSVNRFGKPTLDTDAKLRPDWLPVEFNLSHSGSLVIYAFSVARRVGVDIEWIEPGLDFEPLIEACLSKRETEEIASLPLEARRQAFFSAWTRKEAYLKARGDGLSSQLNGCEVALRSGEDEAPTDQWRLEELDVRPDYAGALIVEGYNWRLNCWDWPPAAAPHP